MTDPHDDHESAEDTDLVARLAALPKEMEPTRDLWPHIEARLATPRPRAAVGRWAVGAAGLAAAAGLALALGLSENPRAPTQSERAQAAPRARVPAPSRAGDVELVPGEAAYAAAAVALDRAIADRRAVLPPDLARVFRDNLAVVDRAIADGRRALAHNPGDEALRDLLDHAYRQKIDLLEQLSRIPVT